MALLRNSSTQSTCIKRSIVSEDEWMPFRADSFDGAISCLNAHWIENLKSISSYLFLLILQIMVKMSEESYRMARHS